MCEFFSCISDGKGKVLYFTPEQIVGEMAKGNPQSYDWNSHTSIAHFNGLSAVDEDKWNKWEYNPEQNALIADTLNTIDDKRKVKQQIRAYLKTKDVIFLRNLYNCNTGDCNTGNRNTGYRNTGNCNTGNCNTGDRNTGNCNTGDCNTGNRNTGDCNTGNRNTGLFNTNEPLARLFNKECDLTLSQLRQENKVPTINLPLVVFVDINKMTKAEKTNYPQSSTIGGYLKVLDYKQAWKKFWKQTTMENKKKFFCLPNFDAKIFTEITGIVVPKGLIK